MPQFPALDRNIECDVLIIGGGMAGILTAHYLKENGIEAVVAEGRRIGGGVTKNTTAVITAQHDRLYSELAKMHGVKGAQEYLAANLWAVDKLKELAGNGCDLEAASSVIYTRHNAGVLKKEAEFLSKLGYRADYITGSPLPFKIAAGLRFSEMAQFHPLKFISKISKGLNIYENTYITALKKNTAFTKNNNRIEAKHIVVATHYPFKRLTGLYFMKMFQNRSYVIGLKSNQKLDGTYVSYDGDGHYFRQYKDYILIGGGDRRVGTKVKGSCFDSVRQLAKDFYPDAAEEFAFAAQDCMSLDGVPYIGRYGKENRYVATGFNEWGMTSSMIGAKLITDMIMGKDTRESGFGGVFCPNRTIFRKQLFKNLGTVVISLLKPTAPRCTHLGSSLKRNKTEDTWECASHGSRFNAEGRIIDNPAMKDIT